VRITVITGDHHAPDPDKRGGRYNEEDFVTHAAMVEALSSFDDLAVEVMNDHGGFLDRFRRDPPDLVINFCDTGFRNRISLELHIPAYLELLGIPCTGAPPSAIVLCYDKAVVRLLAQSLGIAVPKETFLAVDEPFDAGAIDYPSLIKPNKADGSLGITKDAVARDPDEARRYVAWLRQALPGRAILIQEFLSGDEYGIGLIGNPGDDLEALPALEVDYSDLPDGLNPILSYESKALPDSPYWTRIRFARARLDSTEERAMADSARRLFARVGLRDYGRFDFRRGVDGVVKLMEVNPNPAWANDGKLAFMASFSGIEYRDMLRRIVDAACRRCGLTG
jgi:D-alanine-D-alanine ligase